MNASIFTEDHQLNIPAIKEILVSFYYTTDIPVTLYDKDTKPLWDEFEQKKICKYFSTNDELVSCQNAKHFSATWAHRLGEPYIFVCPSGFVNIAIALLDDSEFIGSVVAGPLAMGPIEKSTIRDMFTIHEASPDVLYSTTLFIQNMKIFTPKQVTHIARLLNAAILSLYPDTRMYEQINDAYHEQSQISEQIHAMKKNNTPLVYPYEEEQTLIHQIKSGAHDEAQATLKLLINKLLLIEGGNLEIIKARILELVTIISRASVEGGASLEKIFGLNLDLITELNRIDSIQVLSAWSDKMVQHFSRNIFNHIYAGDSYLICQAIEHTRCNYMNKLTLQKLAHYLHVSESYLSRLFKEETGISFTQYLNEIRINRSKELLSNTQMSIVEIALFVGYEDQSYFTKVFRRLTGMTPKKFRLMNTASTETKKPSEH